jgi:hypothetical protein
MSEQPQTDSDRATRNAILATRDFVQGSKSTLPFQSNKEELGITVETFYAPLPSGGLLYPPEHPLHNLDSAEIKAMTAKEENILMSRALIRKGTVINELIKSSLINKSINVMSLLSGDRMALMFAIRAKGYGDTFEQKMTCPDCTEHQEEIYAISGFKLKELDLEKLNQVTPGENLFSFKLPVSEQIVVFKFLNGNDEEVILQTIEAKKKKGIQNEEVVTTRLLQQIVAIGEKTDKAFIAKFIQNMPARDSRALRTHMEENEPGMDTSKEFTCNNCGFQGDLTPPLGASFLWPDK